MSLRIYVAASLRMAWMAEYHAASLRSLGWRVQSSWHAIVGENAIDPSDEASRRDIGIDNMSEIRASNAMLFLAGFGTPRAAFAEFGAAVRESMPVVYVLGSQGEGRCIWDSMPCVHRVERESSVIPAFRVIEREMQESSTRLRTIPEAAATFRLAGDIASSGKVKAAR